MQLICNLALKRRQIWRRLWHASFGRPSKSVGQLVKLDLVGVLLRGIRARMTHQRLQSYNVAAALPEKTIGKAMPKLVRGKGANAPQVIGDPPRRPLERLVAEEANLQRVDPRHPLELLCSRDLTPAGGLVQRR